MSTTTATLPKTMNPMRELTKYGQSVWLDYIRRSLISSGELKRLIDEDGLGGVTSNPAIFEKAITGSTDYTDALLELQKRKDLDAMAIYEILAIKDIQDAADTLRPVYDRTKKRDGYVSLEVSPFLAKDTEGTIKDARRLWKAVNRPNLMVKIPATRGRNPGHPAMHQRRASTSTSRCCSRRRCTRRWRRPTSPGLKTYAASGGDPQPCRQRRQLLHQPHRQHGGCDREGQAEELQPIPRSRRLLKSLMGKVAIANAKLTYQRYKEIFSGPEWDAAGQEGRADPASVVGQHQHQGPQLLRRDVRRRTDRPRHGEHHSAGHLRRFPRSWQAEGQPGSRSRRRPRHHGHAGEGRHLDEESHRRPGDAGREAVRRAVRQAAERGGRQVQSCVAGRSGSADLYACRPSCKRSFKTPWRIGKWRARCAACGLATPRCGPDRTKASWLGWLGITEDQLANKQHFEDVAADVKAAGFKHALLLGMGGSSLCPEVLKMTFGKIDGFPEMFVLDSTDPAQVKAFENKIDIAQYDFHRLEQIRLDARTEHLQTVFLRAGQAGGGRRESRQPLHRHHRSRLEIRAGGAGRRLPAHLPRRSEHRRPLLGALGFRHGAGGRDGHGRAQVSGSRRRHGHRLLLLPARG